MHEKFGYISKTNPYTSEYIYLFKQNLPFFKDFYEKIDFVLNNIDPIEYPNIEYWERRWKHEKILKELFSGEDISKKLHVVEFFKREDNGTMKFMNGFFVNSAKGLTVYLYSVKDNKYNGYSLPEFANKVKNENIEYRQGVMGLRRELDKLKNQKDTAEI